MATTEMEYNGMVFDKELAVELSKPLMEEAKQCRDTVAEAMEIMGFPKDVINVGSNQQVSVLLFGGSIKYKEQDYILDEDGNKTYYKSGIRKGQPKMKYFEKTKDITSLIPPMFPKGKNGYYPVGDAQLSKVKAKYKSDKMICDLVDNILKFRQLEKDVNTYYIGYAKQVMPDGCIHGNYNHTKTGTGRLSSSNPNLQNLSN
jgi:DNA polymerase I-like protein with 3'-5' exonuclease and polymerase domains